MLVLTLLRPHNYAMNLRQRHRTRGGPDRTPRQLEILRLVSARWNNAQVARSACRRPRSASTLETIYARLGVTNRMAAVARARALEYPGSGRCRGPRTSGEAMSLAYRLMYGVGHTPWEQLATLSGLTERISALFAREESEHRRPYGPALDLGCGSGIWAVKLAQRGWRVTGVDFVPKALRLARRRAQQAGVEIRLIKGDVTKLRASGIGSRFAFLLDFGVFHDELTDQQRCHAARARRRCRRVPGRRSRR